MRPAADDQRLRREVVDALYRESTADASEIRVMVERGIVTLSGRVFDEFERRSAHSTVLAVPGVGAVVDALRVMPYRSSLSIAAIP